MAPLRLGRVATLIVLFCAAFPASASALTTPRRHRSRALSAAHHPCVNVNLRPTSTNLKLIRVATLCLINRERRLHGERPLRPNRRLRRAAQAHSQSMALGDYFQHSSPSGQTPLARMRSVGYISSSRVGFEVGENIAWGTLSLATPRAIVASWMASPGHRANILDPHYRETGIGVSPHPISSRAHGQAGAIYTQDFGVIMRG
jgi:uncharacterized protein YkwD